MKTMLRKKGHKSVKGKVAAHAPSGKPGGEGRTWPKWLLLGLLAAGSFGATFALVRWQRSAAGPPGMFWVPGGEFTMGEGSELGRAEEKPAHRVRVDPFWFVEATGYKTTAEEPIPLADLTRDSPPGSPLPPQELFMPGSKDMLRPGSIVFTPPSEAVPCAQKK